MRYLLMIGGEHGEGHDSREVCGSDEGRAWVGELERRGMFRGGELLRPAGEARTVRVREGEVLISDGPFAETKEQVGGFTMIECTDLDEAIEVAAKHPVARMGMIEVRPIWEQ